MDFGKQMRDIRRERNLTQDQVAETLCVSRQAVSNWENNKNLPDIEQLIAISQNFGVTLDELILGENDMKNTETMREKLIRDGSINQRMRYTRTMVIVGAVLLAIGAALLIIKGMSVEYIDEDGMLHENFFLIPIAMLFILSSVVTFVIALIGKIVSFVRDRK